MTTEQLTTLAEALSNIQIGLIELVTPAPKDRTINFTLVNDMMNACLIHRRIILHALKNNTP